LAEQIFGGPPPGDPPIIFYATIFIISVSKCHFLPFCQKWKNAPDLFPLVSERFSRHFFRIFPSFFVFDATFFKFFLDTPPKMGRFWSLFWPFLGPFLATFFRFFATFLTLFYDLIQVKR
jgi:hypothetical protein